MKEKTSLKGIAKNYLTNTNGKKGITLIALVITIIVLLILAGVSIATLTGENGILRQAAEAKKSTEIASVKEQAKMDITTYVAEKLKNGEDATVNTPEKVQQILDEANSETTNRYYDGYSETGVKTPSGYEVPYEELYTIGNNGGNNEDETSDKTVIDLKKGDKVYYDTGIPTLGESGIIECVVLYDNTEDFGVQIAPVNPVDTYKIGVYGNFTETMEQVNGFVEDIYNKAQDYINPDYASAARCLGSDPANPNNNTEDVITCAYDWFEKYNQKFKGNLELSERGKQEIDTLSLHNVICPTRTYLISDISFECNLGYSTYNSYITCIDPYGAYGELANELSYDYYPVITLKNEIKVTTGNGNDTPYTLEK